MKQRIKVVITSLLVVLFVSYYASATLFYHSHITSSGIITHSHAYAGDATSHSHSQRSFEKIEHLSAIFFVLTFVALLGQLFARVHRSEYSFSVQSCLLSCSQHFYLRGPPVL